MKRRFFIILNIGIAVSLWTYAFYLYMHNDGRFIGYFFNFMLYAFFAGEMILRNKIRGVSIEAIFEAGIGICFLTWAWLDRNSTSFHPKLKMYFLLASGFLALACAIRRFKRYQRWKDSGAILK